MNSALYSSFAYADAIHDFKHLASTNKSIIEEGLPEKPYTFLFAPMKDMEHIIRGIASKRSYDISVLDTSDPDAMFRQLKGEARSFGIISDARFAGPILDILATSHFGPFYFIQNIESWNDAGPKLPEPYLRSIPNLRLLHDAPTTSVTYHAWYPDRPDYDYKFCSVYSYTLLYDSGMPKMTVKSGDASIVTYDTLQNKNSTPAIRDFINNPIKSNTEKSIAFQRKRSGDWMQILSCKDTQRIYTTIDGTSEKVDDIPIYFCTTDNIAIGYSLAIGINTIFYNTTDRVIYVYMANPIPYISTDTISLPPDRLQRLLAVYDRVHDVYVSEIQKIEHAVTNADIKQALRYAFAYTNLMEIFYNILPIRETIYAYIANPSLGLDVRRDMIPWIKDAVSRIDQIELDHNLDDVQILFPPFDVELPSGRKVENTYAPIDITGSRVFGKHELCCSMQLDMLYRREGILQDFVKKCIKKIIQQSVGNTDIHTYYTTYLQTKGIDISYLQHGGDAITREVSYRRIYSMLMEYLNDPSIHVDEYGFSKRPSELSLFIMSCRVIIRETQHTLPDRSLFDSIMLEILRRSSIPPTEYIDYVNALDEELYSALEPLLSDTPFASTVARFDPYVSLLPKTNK